MTAITISGVGNSQVVTVDPEATLRDVLSGEGIDPEASGLNVEVNGESVNPDEYKPENGDQVVQAVRKAKLGI